MPRLTAVEAAERLGVQRATLYAYVSRGLIERTVAEDGRTSLFDGDEIDRFRRGRKPDREGELQTLITTSITLVDDQGLRIRGHDLVALVAEGRTFTDIVDLLWETPGSSPNQADPSQAAPDRWPLGPTAMAATPPPGTVPAGAPLLDALRILVATCSADDALRHDLSPASVRAVGRRLIVAMASSLGPGPHGATVAERIWHGLAEAEAEAGRQEAAVRAVDGALALLVDHGLAGSTFAARVAASVRADPYSVVGAGLGVMGGPLHGAASSAVHELLADGERSGDIAAAIGAAHRRVGGIPGFGHSVYRLQDPRYGALMTLLIAAWGDDPRLVNVYRVRDLVSQRSDAIPNVDLALGALTYLAGMPVDGGEAIFAISRTAGWLAHALEEYGEKPLRFRARAKYVGPRT